MKYVLVFAFMVMCVGLSAQSYTTSVHTIEKGGNMISYVKLIIFHFEIPNNRVVVHDEDLIMKIPIVEVKGNIFICKDGKVFTIFEGRIKEQDGEVEVTHYR